MEENKQLAQALKNVKLNAERAYWTASYMQGLAEYMSNMMEGAAMSLGTSIEKLDELTE
jgi:hypothetical protein